MATIQDIRTLELKIYEAVEEYLGAPDTYDRPVLHVYLDKDRMEYRAEIAEGLTSSEDDGVYAVESVVREGDGAWSPTTTARARYPITGYSSTEPTTANS